MHCVKEGFEALKARDVTAWASGPGSNRPCFLKALKARYEKRGHASELGAPFISRLQRSP